MLCEIQIVPSVAINPLARPIRNSLGALANQLGRCLLAEPEVLSSRSPPRLSLRKCLNGSLSSIKYVYLVESPKRPLFSVFVCSWTVLKNSLFIKAALNQSSKKVALKLSWSAKHILPLQLSPRRFQSVTKSSLPWLHQPSPASIPSTCPNS